jgi:hypothetical protein
VGVQELAQRGEDVDLFEGAHQLLPAGFGLAGVVHRPVAGGIPGVQAGELPVGGPFEGFDLGVYDPLAVVDVVQAAGK